MPYYPLWQRLFIALSCHFKPDSDEFNFCLNPVQFIIEQYAEHFEENGELLFVPIIENEQEIPFILNEKDKPFSYSDNIDFENEFSEFAQDNISIKLLNPTKPAVFNGVEIAPYNVPLGTLPNKPAELEKFQQNVISILNSKQSIEQKISDLRQLYDFNFKQRNPISLFLYIGKTEISYLSNSVNIFRRTSLFDYTSQIQNHCWGILYNKTALLYTGDGELKNLAQLNTLFSALGDFRKINIFAFQVPHHGSKHNAFAGLAKEIDPCISIFSADPNNPRYNHPNAVVVKDFLPYNPILVDKDSGVYFTIK